MALSSDISRPEQNAPYGLDICHVHETFDRYDIGRAPAFCLSLDDADIHTYIDTVNKLREEGMLANLTYPYIVGYIRTRKHKDLLYTKFKEKQKLHSDIARQKAYLSFGIAEGNDTTQVVYSKYDNTVDLGSPALVAAVRAVQTRSSNGEEGMMFADIVSFTDERRSVRGRWSKNAYLQQHAVEYLDGVLDECEVTEFHSNISTAMKKILSPAISLKACGANEIYGAKIDLKSSTDLFRSRDWKTIHPYLVWYISYIEHCLLQSKDADYLFVGAHRITESLRVIHTKQNIISEICRAMDNALQQLQEARPEIASYFSFRVDKLTFTQETLERVFVVDNLHVLVVPDDV